MGEDEELSRLQQELKITRALLEEVRALAMRAAAPIFNQMLLYERRRCERYNHFFCLITVAADRAAAGDVLRKLGRALRSSDVLGVVNGKNGDSTALEGRRNGQVIIGVILPETDRQGGERALERLTSGFPSTEDVTVRMAVYPDDATEVAELLAITVP